MIIKLRGMKQGEHKLNFIERPTDYGLDREQFVNDIKSDISLNVQDINYYIKIDTETEAVFRCDRCLEAYTAVVVSDMNIIYSEDQSLAGDNDKEGLYFLSPGTDSADLTEDVGHGLTLSLPLKKLCKDSCKGLCSQCGKNLNRKNCGCVKETIDPRWEVLKNINLNGSDDQKL